MPSDSDQTQIPEQRCTQCRRIPWSIQDWDLLSEFVRNIPRNRFEFYENSVSEHWRRFNYPIDTLDLVTIVLRLDRISNRSAVYGANMDRLRALVGEYGETDNEGGEAPPTSGDETPFTLIQLPTTKEGFVYFRLHSNIGFIGNPAAEGCWLCRSLQAYAGFGPLSQLPRPFEWTHDLWLKRPRRSYFHPWDLRFFDILLQNHRAISLFELSSDDEREIRYPLLKFGFIIIGTSISELQGIRIPILSAKTTDQTEKFSFSNSTSNPDSNLPILELTMMTAIRQGTRNEDVKSLVDEVILPWIQSCDDAHDKCRPKRSRNQDCLPTRLIDVGSSPSDQFCRIVVSENIANQTEPLRYLALSYCWGIGGSNESAKTKPENLKERRRAIDVSSLPPLIQDAILLTRLMRVRFLWVDALCIIQDDDQRDFTLEAANMGSYYANAYCLISASGFSDSSKELFPERGVANHPTKVCTLGYDGEEKKFQVLPDPAIALMKKMVKSLPVMQRAWCLQERLLSTRAVHVTPEAVFWKCHTEREKAEFDCGNARNIVPPLEPYEIFGQNWTADIWQHWSSVVQTYSNMSLGREDDRLPAIQGLGDQLAVRYEDKYFAGVFLSHLAQGLVWRGRARPKELRSTRCPTWSWGTSRSVKFHECSESLVEAGDDTFPSSWDAIELLRPEHRALRLSAPLFSLSDLPFTEKLTFHQSVYRCPDMNISFSFWFDENGHNPLPEDQNKVKIALLGHRSDYDYLVGLILQESALSSEYFERLGFVMTLPLGQKPYGSGWDKKAMCNAYRRDFLLI
ncbi:hypothetical protein FMUND_3221 [Fusarium mundagurra]|uniref:Heterokaryon incompatibility domain-containing protein n=1 Tax=Fusarium mundagurra TaxID=1567541 RepID=A0A8H6DMF1_9HYPO|nr:hypothetical protein FMUND_3221 [Fusarium mundagurra]